MPGGLSGVELVRAARLQRPGLKAVLTSGYLAGNLPGASTSADIAATELPLLTKPYGQEALARVITEALGRDAAGNGLTRSGMAPLAWTLAPTCVSFRRQRRKRSG